MEHPRNHEKYLLDRAKDEHNPEARQAARKIVLTTMGIEENNEITKNTFETVFSQAVERLSRYRKIETALENIPQESLPHELFKLLRPENDKKSSVAADNAPRDGVFLRSIEVSGVLECAGRTLIVSQLLSKKKINHAVATAPGHSFVVFETNDDTLGYLDANNDIYFTFPQEALVGYQGSHMVSDCTLQPYTPRPNDQVDGLNSVFTHFVTTPPFEGVARQYFGNVVAALAGHEEFVTSGIAVNEEQKLAVQDWEEELLGEQDKKLSDFLNQEDVFQAENEKEISFFRAVVLELLATYPGKERFADQLAVILLEKGGKVYPYIQQAPLEKRLEFGSALWEKFQAAKVAKEV